MRSLVVALALLGSITLPTVAQDRIQGDMVLDIEGLAQPIAVHSWSWGVTQTGSARAGAGGGAGRARFEEFKVTKLIDATSPQLLVDTASGRHFPSAVLTVRVAGGGYVRYTLEDVLISGLTVDSSTGAPMESLSFNYGKIEIEHGGSGQAAPVKGGWDVARNTRI